MKTANIAIFASGNGSNAQKIMEHFSENEEIKVLAVFTNKKDAGVVELAQGLNIPVVVFSKDEFYLTGKVVERLLQLGITHIVLAGFLWLIPADLIRLYKDRIINIHPALLPKFGGKGMYGLNVHKAVREAGEKETGITIHLVNEHYDEGRFILQKKTELTGLETPEEIALKVQRLEHLYFSKTVEDWVKSS